MSSRARVVAEAERVRAFAWGIDDLDEEPPACAASPPPAQALEPPPHQAAPEPSAHEQQARLAALERDAFAKGYAQGERAGVEAGAKRAEAMLRRVAQTLEELGQLRKIIIKDTERQIVQLALALARRLVTREVSLDPTLIAAMAHVALERIGDVSPATIKLHPDDYAIVMANRGEPWDAAQVGIVADPAVARGGCLVESAFGVVDGSLDAQFDEMARALLGDVPAQPAGTAHGA